MKKYPDKANTFYWNGRGIFLGFFYVDHYGKLLYTVPAEGYTWRLNPEDLDEALAKGSVKPLPVITEITPEMVERGVKAVFAQMKRPRLGFSVEFEASVRSQVIDILEAALGGEG